MLIAASWRNTAGKKNLERLEQFARMVLVNTLSPQQKQLASVYILTAPIRSGKTTSLAEFSVHRNDVYGILTPVVSGERVFRDAHSGEEFPMEAKAGETEIISVGRYRFSKDNFQKAVSILKRDMDKPGWLIIDEIGPLELRDQGFTAALKDILITRKEKLLLVVREGLVSQVKAHFNIEHSIEIKEAVNLEAGQPVC